MDNDRNEGGAREALGAVADDLHVWHQAHPQATFYDIEVAVEAHLAQARARLVAEVAAAGEGVERPTGVGADHPRCPTCREPLIMRGQHMRTLTGRGGESMRLRRPYGFCPACNAGLFPPG